MIQDSSIAKKQIKDDIYYYTRHMQVSPCVYFDTHEYAAEPRRRSKMAVAVAELITRRAKRRRRRRRRASSV